MVRKAKDVTDAELALLEVLWSQGESTVRDLAAAVYPGDGVAKAATVQKLCDRLAAKGYVARDRGTRPARLRALVARGELIGQKLQGVAESLCAGSFAPLLTQLVSQQHLSSDELGELKDLITRLESEAGEAG
jgi:BlaI family transcriptional regulator, penicillinase repressor